VLLASLMVAGARAQGLEVEARGDVEEVRNSLDFVSHMGEPIPADAPKTKEAVLRTLGRLTAVGDRDSNPDLVAAWNLLDQTDALSGKEKAGWVERRMADLPPPFVMLAAVYRSADDPARGMELYLFSRIRLLIDASKCADPSAEEAAMSVVQLLAPRFNLGVDRSKTSNEECGRVFADLMRRTAPAALRLHQTVPNRSKHPWWAAHAGMQEIVDGLVGRPDEGDEPSRARGLFKPEKEWPQIEREIVDGFREQLAAAR
jgi:hypothetical protein